MNLNERYYVACPAPLRSFGEMIENGLGQSLVSPLIFQFQLARRMVVRYVCEECREAGCPVELCGSPEWCLADDWGGQIPEDVERWCQEHARWHAAGRSGR